MTNATLQRAMSLARSMHHAAPLAGSASDGRGTPAPTGSRMIFDPLLLCQMLKTTTIR